MSPKDYCQKYDLTGAAFGRLVGLSKFTACRLIKNEQKVSPQRAIAIERATNGEVTRHDLRPDIFEEASLHRTVNAPDVAENATPRQGVVERGA